MSGKKKLRRRIAELERELVFSASPPAFVTAAVRLGSTGGGANEIDWPILIGHPGKPLDLPGLGYIVRKRRETPEPIDGWRANSVQSCFADVIPAGPYAECERVQGHYGPHMVRYPDGR